MTVTVPPLPTGLEDPAGDEKRNLMNGQMESTLDEALDRLCKPVAAALTYSASSDWSYPAAELASSSLAFIIVLAAAETALVEAAVFGVLDVPLVADIQLAQHDPKHDLLRSAQ